MFKGMKVAIQLYSVHEEAAENLKETLKGLKDMGYEGVEFAGLYGNTPEQTLIWLNDIDLKAVSAHVSFEELINDSSGIIESYKILGCKYIAIPSLNKKYLPGGSDYEKFKINAATIISKCKKYGMILMYHNHDFEFVRINGEYALDIMYREIPGMQSEIDTCWVKTAGEDPVEYIKKYAGRAPIVHFKDYVDSKKYNADLLESSNGEYKETNGNDDFEFRPVGMGVQDLKALINASAAAGTEWIIVEQDRPCLDLSPMQCAKKSIGSLQNINRFGKVTTLSGGADAEAKVMRESILNSKDSLNITGIKYYVSPNGNDKNDGKSPENALKSLNSLNALHIKNGDAVLFERGGIYRTVAAVELKSGVTYGAYGMGQKPEIYGSAENYAREDKWKTCGKENVWHTEMPTEDVGVVVFNHCKDTIGIKQAGIGALTKNGDFYHDLESGILYLYNDKENPGNMYRHIEIGTHMTIFNLRNYCNITIDNLCLKYSGAFAISGSGNCNIKILNCEIGWIGGTMQYFETDTRYGNAIQFWNGCENILIENCWIYHVFDAGFTFQGNNNSAYKNIMFRNNLLEYCGCSFEWWSRDFDAPIDNIVFKGNISRFGGYGWGINTHLKGHIYVGGPRTFLNLGSFQVQNNIFDCASAFVYFWLYEKGYDPQSKGYIMCDNTYYQKPNHETERPNSILCYGSEGVWNKPTHYAKNQKEFEEAVAIIDTNPKMIKWIE